jgi:hypothetical protein
VDRLLPWTSLHAGWAGCIAERLNLHWLPERFVARERVYSGGHPEIDIATFHQPGLAKGPRAPSGDGTPPPYVVPAPAATVVTKSKPDLDVRVEVIDPDVTLVAVVELISPSNKDRPAQRRSFVDKVVSLVLTGVGVVVIDVVTTRRFNLHNDVVELNESPPVARLADDSFLYASSYRPKIADEETSLDVWAEPLAVGRPLPAMPRRLTGDTFVPVEFEETYTETCRRRKLT